MCVQVVCGCVWVCGCVCVCGCVGGCVCGCVGVHVLVPMLTIFCMVLSYMYRRRVYRMYEAKNCNLGLEERVGVPQRFGIHYAVGTLTQLPYY